MYFYQEPFEFQKFLTEKGLIDTIYKSIQQDEGDAVVTAMKILRKTNKMPMITKVPAMEEASRFFRQLADQTLEAEDYRNAFDFYNQALRCGPKNSSNSMLEAYFGRSRLYFHTQTCAAACIADINRCLAYKHSEYQRRLKQMKAVSLKRLKETETPPRNQFIENFFNIGKKHPHVPSVSAEIDFVIENGKTKVVAGKNIPIGTVVALETAYIGHLGEKNQIRACHFCHAFTLNLIPCDSCSFVLFCSEACKKLCWEEYHNVECQIIDVLDVINAHNTLYPLTVKAALKLKNLCSWEEFITLSTDLGLKDMNSGLINEVYDVNNKLSIIRFNNDKHFVIGTTYNAAFIYAIIVHYLEGVPSFFPCDVKEKEVAMRALGRVMVHLRGALGHIIKLENIAKNYSSEAITTLQERNYGLFSFTSKLKHSCDPNVYIVGLNNKVALIALRPIKSGEELTKSDLGHWYDASYQNRALKLFIWSEITCQCPVCVKGWSAFNLQDANMNEQQKKILERWNNLMCASVLNMIDISDMYKESWYCFGAFQNQPNTKEHKRIFDEIRRIILFPQFENTKNCSILDPFKNTITRT